MQNTDYRELCIELFGTDDADELRVIADKINRDNPRNAGRKKKFTADELRQMAQLLGEGYTVNELAERFHTSRQVVSKYINQPLTKEYPLRITCMYQQCPTTVIYVDFLHEKVKIQNRTDDLLHRAFGVIEQPSWEDYDRFLRERCFPEARGNAKQLLRALQTDGYDPLQIVEKTAGRMAEDALWLKFDYYEGGGQRGTSHIRQ